MKIVSKREDKKKNWQVSTNRSDSLEETEDKNPKILGKGEWSDSPDIERSDFPRQNEVLWQYIGSTWLSQPGDCCSPTQVQDQQSSVQNQQEPTKDLADEIRNLWHRRQM